MATASSNCFANENPLAIDLFNFLWMNLNHDETQIPNHNKSYFNEDIGYAVLYRQFIIRDCLRSVFKGMQIADEDDFFNVTRKICRARRHSNPVLEDLFIEYFAIIAEVYLYCKYWLYLPLENAELFLSWDLIFTRRRIQELLDNGGFQNLASYAAYQLCENITMIGHHPEKKAYPYEAFFMSQRHNERSRMMADEFQESLVDLNKKRKFQVDKRELHRLNKSTRRLKRVEDQLIASNKIGTRDGERILAAQSKFAVRSLQRSEPMGVWEPDISPYVTSDDECEFAEISPTVAELCTMLSSVQVSKKKQKKKKKKTKECEALPTACPLESICLPNDSPSESFAYSPPQSPTDKGAPIKSEVGKKASNN